MTQIRQDQVDAGLIVAGEQHTAVDDQQPAQMLENGHVAADFADSAQRGHPQTSGGQRPRRTPRSVVSQHAGRPHVGGEFVDLGRGGRDLR